MSNEAVLLIAHGSPERAEDVPEFLQNVTHGRAIPEEVVREVQHRYSLVGGSPLTRITRQQAESVALELGIPVYVGMRNWHPLLAGTVQQMASDGVENAVAICLAPQNSRTSVGLYKQALFRNQLPFAMDFVAEWHSHPLLIAAFAEKLRAGWTMACAKRGSSVPVIFTAHSVPQRTIAEGDPYEAQARETAALVAAQVPEIGEFSFAWQSQGMSGGEWLSPMVEETIESLGANGATGVFIQPIGFVCDNVEILYDIDIFFRQFAREREMKLYRAESLNDSPLFIQAIAGIALERLRGSRTKFSRTLAS